MKPEIREYLTVNTSVAATRRRLRDNFDQVLDSSLSPSEQASRLAAKALHDNFGTRINENDDIRSRGGLRKPAGGQTTNPDQFYDFLSPFFPKAPTSSSQISESEAQAVSGLVELNEARRDHLDRLDTHNSGLLPTPDSQPEHNIEYIRALGRRHNKKGKKGKFVESYKSMEGSNGSWDLESTLKKFGEVVDGKKLKKKNKKEGRGEVRRRKNNKKSVDDRMECSKTTPDPVLVQKKENATNGTELSEENKNPIENLQLKSNDGPPLFVDRDVQKPTLPTPARPKTMRTGARAKANGSLTLKSSPELNAKDLSLKGKEEDIGHCAVTGNSSDKGSVNTSPGWSQVTRARKWVKNQGKKNDLSIVEGRMDGRLETRLANIQVTTQASDNFSVSQDIATHSASSNSTPAILIPYNCNTIVSSAPVSFRPENPLQSENKTPSELIENNSLTDNSGFSNQLEGVAALVRFTVDGVSPHHSSPVIKNAENMVSDESSGLSNAAMNENSLVLQECGLGSNINGSSPPIVMRCYSDTNASLLGSSSEVPSQLEDTYNGGFSPNDIISETRERELGVDSESNQETPIRVFRDESLIINIEDEVEENEVKYGNEIANESCIENVPISSAHSMKGLDDYPGAGFKDKETNQGSHIRERYCSCYRFWSGEYTFGFDVNENLLSLCKTSIEGTDQAPFYSIDKLVDPAGNLVDPIDNLGGSPGNLVDTVDGLVGPVNNFMYPVVFNWACIGSTYWEPSTLQHNLYQLPGLVDQIPALVTDGAYIEPRNVSPEQLIEYLAPVSPVNEAMIEDPTISPESGFSSASLGTLEASSSPHLPEGSQAHYRDAVVNGLPPLDLEENFDQKVSNWYQNIGNELDPCQEMFNYQEIVDYVSSGWKNFNTNQVATILVNGEFQKFNPENHN